jgi:hypothetical protein
MNNGYLDDMGEAFIDYEAMEFRAAARKKRIEEAEAKTEFTGTLENWAWSNVYTESLQGDIYFDVRGRWSDGTFIFTSTVTEINEEEGWAKTLNSKYKLGKKHQ